MTLKEYIRDPKRKQELALLLGTSDQYLWQVAVAWRNKRASPELAKRIELATQGVVTKSSLRPDIWEAA